MTRYLANCSMSHRNALRAQGDGGLDHSALLRLVSRLSGRDE
jgi:hypothetical protein